MTNVLVQGGRQLLGSLRDAGQIDECHVFIAPKLIGGHAAPTAVAGTGIELMKNALALNSPRIEQCGTDVYLHGRTTKA